MMLLSLYYRSWNLFLLSSSSSLVWFALGKRTATTSFSTVQVVQDDAATISVRAIDDTISTDDTSNGKATTTKASTTSACEQILQKLSLHPSTNADTYRSSSSSSSSSVWARIGLSLHRNGDPVACGSIAPPSLVQAWQQALLSMGEDACAASSSAGDDNNNSPSVLTLLEDKFQVESFLTYFFLQQSDVSEQCGAVSINEEEENAAMSSSSSLLLQHYCDMGPDKTVIQNDHDKLIRIPVGDTSFLPCRFYTREGLRIVSLLQLQELAEEKLKQSNDDDETESAATATFDLYAVPAGRLFMFAPAHIGEIFQLDHVHDSFGHPIALETLSLEPRIFDIHHFFSLEESEQLLLKAIREKSDTHRFHRSTTGTTGANVISTRTSENAWDTHGALAQKIKRRCFDLLGFDEYVEEMSDGLQILRYNQTNAYTNHMDYLNDPGSSDPYDYDSAGKGGNRFATILLYFTNVESGGETVFPKSWPADVAEDDRVPLEQAIQQLREAGEIDILKRGSWEEKMTAECRTRLTVKPNASRAVLFYSQYPNGELDPYSFHGACPVLNGTKIAANLWTWSAIRPEYTGAPLKGGGRKGISSSATSTSTTKASAAAQPKSLSGVFRNSGKDTRFNENTKLYYEEDVFFGSLGPKDPPISVNTYKGHRWNVKVDGTTLQSFVVGDDAYQEFVV